MAVAAELVQARAVVASGAEVAAVRALETAVVMAIPPGAALDAASRATRRPRGSHQQPSP